MKKIMIGVMLTVLILIGGKYIYVNRQNQFAQVSGAIQSVISGTVSPLSVAAGGTLTVTQTFSQPYNNSFPLTAEFFGFYPFPMIQSGVSGNTVTFTAQVPANITPGQYEFSTINASTRTSLWVLGNGSTMVTVTAPVVVAPTPVSPAATTVSTPIQIPVTQAVVNTPTPTPVPTADPLIQQVPINVNLTPFVNPVLPVANETVYPGNTTFWKKGEVQSISWDKPQSLTGRIKGYLSGGNISGERLLGEWDLAIVAPWSFTVPADVSDSTDYIVTLKKSSDSSFLARSKPFTIKSVRPTATLSLPSGNIVHQLGLYPIELSYTFLNFGLGHQNMYFQQSGGTCPGTGCIIYNQTYPTLNKRADWYVSPESSVGNNRFIVATQGRDNFRQNEMARSPRIQIVAPVRVTAPSAGTNIRPGQRYTISWTPILSNDKEHQISVLLRRSNTDFDYSGAFMLKEGDVFLGTVSGDAMSMDMNIPNTLSGNYIYGGQTVPYTLDTNRDYKIQLVRNGKEFGEPSASFRITNLANQTTNPAGINVTSQSSATTMFTYSPITVTFNTNKAGNYVAYIVPSTGGSQRYQLAIPQAFPVGSNSIVKSREYLAFMPYGTYKVRVCEDLTNNCSNSRGVLTIAP